jgi:hypothetical protein
MRVEYRFLAVVLAAVVWTYAGMSVASRPLAVSAISSASLGAAASCEARKGD